MGCPDVKTVVTGATGFIGRHLISALLVRGEDLRCLVRHYDQELHSQGIEQVVGDLADRNAIRGLCDGAGTVYHLAAAGHVTANTRAAYLEFRRLNVEALQDLLEEACRHRCVEKFVHFSSTAAMGLIEGLADETSTCRPSTAYQQSKHESEQLVMRSSREHGLPAVIVRPSMVYGPGDRNLDFAAMCRMVKRGRFPVPSRITALTPLVYVSDAVQGAILAADHGRPGEVYIVTSSASVPIAELAKTIAKRLGVQRGYVRVPVCIMLAAAAVAEVLGSCTGKHTALSRQRVASICADRSFDISKAQAELGYEPEVDLEQGVAKTVDWLREKRIV
jgi:nucleoside-diphosphate-sugar epimerase